MILYHLETHLPPEGITRAFNYENLTSDYISIMLEFAFGKNPNFIILKEKEIPTINNGHVRPDAVIMNKDKGEI
jgi:hypothetical protein